MEGKMAVALREGERAVLAERLWGNRETALRQALLVAFGVAALILSAKLRVPLPFTPVPVTGQTLVVLAVAAGYGPRLGLLTILAYLAVGAAGFDVFTGSSATNLGLAYMSGATGGYLAGFAAASVVMGMLARRGWDRSVPGMAGAMVVGNLVIYALGLAWLYVLIAGGLYDAERHSSMLSQTLAWGLYPFLVGDALKVALGALALPAIWRLAGEARG